jgi:hypothetical protein
MNNTIRKFIWNRVVECSTKTGISQMDVLSKCPTIKMHATPIPCLACLNKAVMNSIFECDSHKQMMHRTTKEADELKDHIFPK